MNSKTFQRAILNWFDQHGRKDLPWQENKTPYRVWVSEIMLQQTQVSTVITYFSRFMARFPDIQSLAAADEDEVLHLWTGLGYYTRARNLLRTAKMIVAQGDFPNELGELEKLPGIGRSTAGAILAIAFEKRAAILDGNVKRVLTRFTATTTWPGDKKIHDQLWATAETLTPSTRVADYTQAMMDLGATVCTRGKPRCEQCPLMKNCLAYSQGIANQLPTSKPKKTLPVRKTSWLILLNDNKVLLEKRPPTGIWGGLWSLPQIEGTLTKNDLKKHSHRFQCEIDSIHSQDTFRHTFSHFHLEISPIIILIKKAKHKLMEDAQQIWYNLDNPAVIGLPAPAKQLLEKLSLVTL
ncbi:MAG: A/G-specific adenine glycosylase [Gammaproteobacteria bacterium]